MMHETNMNSFNRIKPSILLLAFCAILFTGELSAQPYEHSGGIRAGYSSGITYKGFFRYKLAAVEADVLYNRHGFNLTGMYEYHMETFRNKRWILYVGGGVFGGNWNKEFSLGLAAAGGIEYIVRDLPLNFSLDWKPMLNLYRSMEADFLDFGLSIRYRFTL
jgi:hypothetical protein